MFGWLLLAAARAYILARVTFPDNGKGCWHWMLKGSDGRYAHATFMGMRFKAHRLSYLAFVGPIKFRYVVDHKECDNTQCLCPQHLVSCTQSDNITRCFATGRGRSPFIKRFTSDIED